MRFGVRLEHIDVVVPADNHGRGQTTPPDRGRRSQQVGQLGVGIRGDHQPGIGSRRQPEAILDLLNSAFVRLAGAALEVTQAHDADPGCGGKIGQRPIPRFPQRANGGSRRLAAHRRAPHHTRIVQRSRHMFCVYVLIAAAALRCIRFRHRIPGQEAVMDHRPCSLEPDLWFGYADDDASDARPRPASTNSPPPAHARSACAAARWPSNGCARPERWRPVRSTAWGGREAARRQYRKRAQLAHAHEVLRRIAAGRINPRNCRRVSPCSRVPRP